LGGVTNHLEVATELLSRHGELVPDVHPITVLAINALATDLNLDLGNKLLTNEIEPAGIDTESTSITSVSHRLVDLRESYLEVGAVGEITVAGDRAGHTATEIGLARECLLDGLHSEVCVSAVRDFPECDLGCSSEEDVLCAIGDELHECSGHFC